MEEVERRSQLQFSHYFFNHGMERNNFEFEELRGLHHVTSDLDYGQSTTDSVHHLVMRRRKSDAKYDDATIQMLDSINFQPTPTFSSRSGLADTEEVYSLNTLKRALNVSLEKNA
uniref:Uncharacterized protein n=1 Tax=Ditylenchus dipsaci TaxID=166011 RepID=A0A915DGN0_9BILA